MSYSQFTSRKQVECTNQIFIHTDCIILLYSLAENKCQRCIEFRVMFRVELHFWQDFFTL